MTWGWVMFKLFEIRLSQKKQFTFTCVHHAGLEFNEWIQYPEPKTLDAKTYVDSELIPS
jgi:hypothetical protein